MTVEQPNCASGHRFEYHDGVLVLMNEQRRADMDEYLRLFREFRTGRGDRITDPSVYDRLPFSREVMDNPAWRLRRQDAHLVDHLVRGRGALRALDLGAWNCWLSHHLAIAGHEVVAIDDFDDPHDGLRAVQHYSTGAWTSIRMDIDQVDLLDETFDLIVVNRCFFMLNDSFQVLDILKDKLRTGGQLVLTGLNVFHDSTAIRDHYLRLRRNFFDRYGREIGFKDFKGYMDPGEVDRLRRHGVSIRHYWRQLPATARALFDPSRPRYYYGVYQRRSEARASQKVSRSP